MEYQIDALAREAADFLEPILKRHSLFFAESMGLPFLGEGERVRDLFVSLEAALSESPRSQLILTFINERHDSRSRERADNQKTLALLGVPEDMKFSFQRLGPTFHMVINGTRAEARLQSTEGVGRARKVLADTALELFRRGRLGEIHRQSDADVIVPRSYFCTDLPARAVGATYPYFHSQGELTNEEFQNLQIYEKWLASYCEGLERAGSPYAYWALGSTLMFRLSAYEKVRGVPNVRAGEDFHFLAKLRKVGPIVRHAEPRLEIFGRHSDRVPFGTGRALENMATAKRNYEVYAPEIFIELGGLIRAIDQLAKNGHWENFESGLTEYSKNFFVPFRIPFQKILGQGSKPEQKRKLLHESFDALATLRWVNGKISIPESYEGPEDPGKGGRTSN